MNYDEETGLPDDVFVLHQKRKRERGSHAINDASLKFTGVLAKAQKQLKERDLFLHETRNNSHLFKTQANYDPIPFYQSNRSSGANSTGTEAAMERLANKILNVPAWVWLVGATVVLVGRF